LYVSAFRFWIFSRFYHDWELFLVSNCSDILLARKKREKDEETPSSIVDRNPSLFRATLRFDAF
jgi:hypothetical protein